MFELGSASHKWHGWLKRNVLCRVLNFSPLDCVLFDFHHLLLNRYFKSPPFWEWQKNGKKTKQVWWGFILPSKKGTKLFSIVFGFKSLRNFLTLLYFRKVLWRVHLFMCFKVPTNWWILLWWQFCALELRKESQIRSFHPHWILSRHRLSPTVLLSLFCRFLLDFCAQKRFLFKTWIPTKFSFWFLCVTRTGRRWFIRKCT